MANILSRANLNKTIRYLKKNGVSEAYYAAKERIGARLQAPYSYLEPTDAELEYQREKSAEWEQYGNGKFPKITLVIPTYNTPDNFLRDAIESVLAQTYPNWELVLADASDMDDVERVVTEYVKVDTQSEMKSDAPADMKVDAHADTQVDSACGAIKYFRLGHNNGISANTNEGLDKASGDYIAFMDHDDILTVDALYHMVKAIRENDAPALLYSDEDKFDQTTSTYFDPHRKLDFNYDLLLTNNYICHLTLIRSDIMRDIRLNSSFDGAQDYDCVLQVVRRLILGADKVHVADLGKNIIHVPRILYHWRSHAASTAENTDSKQYAYEAGKEVIKNHIAKVYGDIDASVSHSKHLGFYDVSWGKQNDVNSVFNARPEVGAIVGRMIDSKGLMTSCVMNEDGEFIYAGLNRRFSGEFNRFDCAQDVGAGIFGNIKVRSELNGFYRMYSEKINDNTSREELIAISKKLCDEIRKAGYLIVYLPMEF